MSLTIYIDDTCPRCRKPVKLSVIEPHQTDRDFAIHNYHCIDCGPVTHDSKLQFGGPRVGGDQPDAAIQTARRGADRLLSSSQAAERGKFLDCQPLAHFRMSASRSLWDLNSSRLYISSQKTFSSSSVIGFASLRERRSASKARLASSLVIIAFT